VFKRLRRHKFEFVEGDWPLPELIFGAHVDDRPSPKAWPRAGGYYNMETKTITIYSDFAKEDPPDVDTTLGRDYCILQVGGIRTNTRFPWTGILCHEINHWGHLRDFMFFGRGADDMVERAAEVGVVW
jgi:hypothetical protein